MSLYNALFGTNQAAPVLLKVLELDQPRKDAPKWPKNDRGEDWYCYEDGDGKPIRDYINQSIEKKVWPTGRFRDISLNEDGTRILLYTRNGGGNREDYFWVFDILSKHPNYVSDFDDDFDNTYATIEFNVPKDYQDDLKKLATGDKPKSVSEKFQSLISDLEEDKDTTETRRAKNVGEKVFGAIEKGQQTIEVKPEDGRPEETKT